MLLQPVDRQAKLVTHVDRALGLASFDTGAALLGHAYADAHTKGPRIVGPGGWQPGAQWRGDGWENPVSGFGTALDKTTYGTFRLTNWLSDTALDQLFHGDDIVERMITTVPGEMLRKGYGLALGDKPGSETESKILKALEALEANEHLTQALWWAALFGDGALVIGADDGRPSSLPLIPELVRKIDWLEAYDRRYYAICTYYTDGPNYGKPETYALGNPGAVSSPMQIVHESRLIRFSGAPTSITMKRARGGYSISKLQRCYETIRSFATSYKAVEILLTDGPQGVYKVDNLASLLGSNNKDKFEARLQAVDLFRSAMRAVVVDAKSESFERQAISFGSIPDVMDRFALRLAAAVPMPVTKLMGQSPAGMNATGDSDFRDWYDGIETDQTNKLGPKIAQLISILCATKEGPTGGAQPKQIKVEFQKLWTLNPKEEAERRLAIAQTDVIYETMGAITPEEIALSRFGERGYSDEYEIDRELRETLVEQDKAESESEEGPAAPPREALGPEVASAVITVDQALAAFGLPADEDPTVGGMKVAELLAKQKSATAPGSHPTDPEQNKPDGFDVQDPSEVAKQEADAKAAALGAKGPPGAKPKAGPPVRKDGDDQARDPDGRFASGGAGGTESPKGGSAPTREHVDALREKAVASGDKAHLNSYLDAKNERERLTADKISAHQRDNLDVGSTPNEVEERERAFSATFGTSAKLDGPGVQSLLGVDGHGLDVRASVTPTETGGVKIESTLTKDGAHVGNLNRTYERAADGSLTVHHDYFVLADDQKGKGLGGSIIAKQLGQYEKLGVGKVELLAAWDGRYVWPKMGFELHDAGEKKLLQNRWKSYLTRTGQPHVPISGVRDVVNHPSGKAFLLGSRAPMLSLSATPATLKERISAKRKASS